MRVLIVEDEPGTGDYLKKGLTENGFAVDLARTGIDGKHLAETGDYDLIVLDVMLPGIDGFRLLQELRNRKREAPVLFLTARDKVEDRVKGLELGADDYLIKPFAFPELLARLRTILRRGKTVAPEILKVADLSLDPIRHRAERGGKRIDLTAKEFALLHLMMQRTGEVLSRTLIASLVWDINFDSDSNVIEVAMGRLRSKIDDPFDIKLIHTIRGVGYALEERRS